MLENENHGRDFLLSAAAAAAAPGISPGIDSEVHSIRGSPDRCPCSAHAKSSWQSVVEGLRDPTRVTKNNLSVHLLPADRYPHGITSERAEPDPKVLGTTKTVDTQGSSVQAKTFFKNLFHSSGDDAEPNLADKLE